MKRKLFALILSLFVIQNIMAQTTTETKEANPADVASIDALLRAVYNVISGDAGQPRDWDRFRTLFYKDARLIPSGKNAQTGAVGARTLSPEDYVKRASGAME